jgi:anti-anti-sigma factor
LTRHPHHWIAFRTIVHLDEQNFVLRVTGDEDRATQGVRRRPLSRALCDATRDLTVDMSELSFADSSLMLDLAMVARRLRQGGRKLILRDPPPHISRLISLVGLDRIEGVLVAAPASA